MSAILPERNLKIVLQLTNNVVKIQVNISDSKYVSRLLL